MCAKKSKSKPFTSLNTFDLIIIGTGSGNTIITPEFDDLDIAIVEKGTFGGTCLNRGCIPSKMLVYVADVLSEISRSDELGIAVDQVSVDWAAIQKRIFGRIDPIANAGEAYRNSLPNVSVFNGSASFLSEHQLRVGEDVIEGDQIVIATGASPVLPDIEGLSVHAAFFDYDGDLDLDAYVLNNSIRSVGSYDLIEGQRNIPSQDGNQLLENRNNKFENVSSDKGIFSSNIGSVSYTHLTLPTKA